jgi:hypothetical protein
MSLTNENFILYGRRDIIDIIKIYMPQNKEIILNFLIGPNQFMLFLVANNFPHLYRKMTVGKVRELKTLKDFMHFCHMENTRKN